VAYEARTFQSSTPYTAPSGTDPLVDNTTSGDVQAVKILDGTAGSTTDVRAGGGAEANALRVTVANDSTGVLSVDDNGATLSVDDGAGSLTVDNAGTFAVQVDGAALTALQLIDNLVTTEDTASANGDSGLVAFARRTASPANTSGTDGDYEALQVSAGRLWTSATVDAALPAGTNNIGDVDVLSIVPGTGATNLGKAEDAVHASGDTGIAALAVRRDTAAHGVSTDGDYATLNVDSSGRLWVNPTSSGDVAHDGVDSGNPVKVGARAIAHSTNPTAVAAADRTDLLANRAGVLFVMGGHPNVVTLEAEYTAAQTNTAIITVSAGTKIVVTQIQAMVDNATTVDVGVRVGFAAATTPTTTGVVLTHPGIAPGSGVSRGDGSGILGIGADGEDLRITSEVPTTGALRILVSYYTIES
jgi:hypothetical protein